MFWKMRSSSLRPPKTVFSGAGGGAAAAACVLRARATLRGRGGGRQAGQWRRCACLGRAAGVPGAAGAPQIRSQPHLLQTLPRAPSCPAPASARLLAGVSMLAQARRPARPVEGCLRRCQAARLDQSWEKPPFALGCAKARKEILTVWLDGVRGLALARAARSGIRSGARRAGALLPAAGGALQPRRGHTRANPSGLPLLQAPTATLQQL